MKFGLLPGVKILMSDFSLKAISEIGSGEKIFTNSSYINEVQNVNSIKYLGKAFQIRCMGQTFKMESSSEQKFFAVRKEFRDLCRQKYSRIRIEVLEKNIELIKANQLKKGDMLIIPKHLITHKINVVYTDQFINTHSNNLRVEIPKQLLLTKELFRWFGYYLAEGMVLFTSDKRYKRKCRGISFTINIKENNIYEDITRIGKKIFNMNPKTIDLLDRNGRRLDYYSTQLGELMYSLFNTGSSNKKIPSQLMFAPEKLLNELINAWLAGDGWLCNSKQHKGRVTGNTTSSFLANQFYLILLNYGKLPAVNISAHKNQKRKKAREKGFYLRHPLYSVVLPKKREVCRRKQNAYFVFTPISEIESRRYNGLIYNLNIEENNSFQANYFWVQGSNMT